MVTKFTNTEKRRPDSALEISSEAGWSQLSLLWNEETYAVNALDNFTFRVFSPALAARGGEASPADIYKGEVRSADKNVAIQFRIREIEGDQVICGFYDLPIAKRERLVKMAETAPLSETDDLQSLSYDELAAGNVSGSAGQSKTGNNTAGTSPDGVTDNPSRLLSRVDQATMKNGIVVAALAGTMLLIVGWLTMVGLSQSTISVSNSVMAGNYQPVNTPLEGKMLDLQVAVGDQVRAGQIVATVSNPSVAHELGLVDAQISRAKRELTAYQRQSTETKAMLNIARKTLRTKRAVAIAVKDRIKGDLRGAQSKLSRLSRLRRSKRVRMGEYEEALALRDRWAAELAGQDAVIEGIVLAEKAAAHDVIVREERIINPMSEIRTKIEIASSLIGEFEEKRGLLTAKSKPTELVAPSSGTVFAIYRRPGEVLKLADEAIAISRDGTSWATGHVPSDVAANIKPGQLVEIEIPSFDFMTTGVVEAIGHRAVHGRGGYTADFRSSPFDVPIRVALDHMDKPIPSGLRLNMTIRVRDRLKELRNWVGSWVSVVASKKQTKPIWYSEISSFDNRRLVHVDKSVTEDKSIPDGKSVAEDKTIPDGKSVADDKTMPKDRVPSRSNDRAQLASDLYASHQQ